MKANAMALACAPSSSPVIITTANRQNSRPDRVSRLGWIRYWAVLPLVLADPFGAQAATPSASHGSRLALQYPPQAKEVKPSKPWPTALPQLPWETAETVQVQPLDLDTPLHAEMAPLTPEATMPEMAALPLEPPENPRLVALTAPESGENLSPFVAEASHSSDEIPWRFSLEPYVYVPFRVSGDVTVDGIEVPIDAGIGDIFDVAINTLNFAAFGRFEAWKGHWGIVFDGAYANLGTGQTVAIPFPPELQLLGLPPEIDIDAAVGVSFSRFDLAAAYRFGDGNLSNAFKTADTEFDLGPFLFDVVAGLRIQNFQNDLELTDSLGDELELTGSQSFFEPMLGGHARWNLSDNLAVLTGGSFSGFGIGDLTFSVDGYAGVDWLFSGNTSLLANYRFTYVDNSDDPSLGLNLFTHGPLVGVKFRF